MTPSYVRFFGIQVSRSRALCMSLMGLSAAAMLSGVTGCSSLDENKRLNTAVEQARAQLAEAENARRALQAQLNELQAKYDQLNSLMQAGGLGNDALRRERDLLAAQLADLRSKYNQLLQLGTGQPALPTDINNMLRDLAAQYPDMLEFDERLGMLRFKSDLTFDRGSTVVSARAKQVLALFAQILNKPEIAKNEVQVVGHTDDIPITPGGNVAQRNPDNWTLSTNRAWSVLAVLHENGLSNSRGMAGGWGDQRPIAPNAAGMKGNDKNRRVDIYIRPTTVPEGIVVSTGAPATRPAPVRAPATRPAAPTTRTAPAATPGSPAVPVPIPG